MEKIKMVIHVLGVNQNSKYYEYDGGSYIVRILHVLLLQPLLIFYCADKFCVLATHDRTLPSLMIHSNRKPILQFCDVFLKIEFYTSRKGYFHFTLCFEM